MNGETSSEHVGHVRLEDFRNYVLADVEFHQGFNIVEGANGQGKTSLLEALYAVSTTKALRGSRDSEVIRDGSETGFAEATSWPNQTLLGIRFRRAGRKEASINGLKLPKASDLIGRLPCVCVSLNDMHIVRGEPADRRHFLDLLLSQCFFAYLRSFAQYKRALEQRNALLRLSQDRRVESEQFDPWEEQMAESGATLRRDRTDFLDQLTSGAQSLYESLSQREALRLTYHPQDDALDAETLLARLRASRDRDVGRGSTTVGPHRDDLELRLDGRPARTHGSLGQQRSAVLALKLATTEFMEKQVGAPPLLLLDDVLSDLDSERRERLAHLIGDYRGQTVLTCTESAAAGAAILERSRRFTVVEGTISPSHG